MTLAVFFHLGGDVDMLAPFLAQPGEDDGLPRRILVAEKLLLSNRRLAIALGDAAAHPHYILPTEPDANAITTAIKGCSALITSSETTLRPHRLAHAATLTANAAGMATITLQHGIENVGITYSDDKQGADVAFASSHVLTWKGLDAVAPEFSDATRAKVIDAGYGPPDDAPFAKWRDRLPLPRDGRPVIGVFENLHWTRFSDAYRSQFLSDLQTTIKAFPNAVFLLKPHPEGRWLTDRFKGQKPEARNLVLAAPSDPVWSLLTAPYLMPLLSAVITTPSKVGLDAAVAGLPVAIPSYDVPYERYAGLPALAVKDQWFNFIEEVLAQPDRLRASSAAFRDSAVSSLNGVANTLAFIRKVTA